MPTLETLRCSVLGAGGFIGTNLCRRLSGRVGYLRGFARRRSTADGMADLDWITGDFQNRETMAAAVADVDIVFHLVNATTPASANADMANDVTQNVLGTLGLLEACRSAGVRRIVYVSSGGTIYGVPAHVPTAETEPCWPITAYGISKLSVERYLHLYGHHHGLDYRVLRVANPYGPHQTAATGQGVIAAFLRRALAGEPVEIWGDGLAARDYLHVDDVACAMEAAAVHEGADRVFNVGSGRPRTLVEIVEAIERVTGTPVAIDRKPSRGVDIPVSCLDISLAARELDWRPTIGLDQGLEGTIAWMRDEIGRAI